MKPGYNALRKGLFATGLVRILPILVGFLILNACSSAGITTPVSTRILTLTPTYTIQQTVTHPVDARVDGPLFTPTIKGCPSKDRCPTAQSSPLATAQPTVRPPFDPASWETLPIIPELSPRAIAILKEGQALGNNPHAFSKIGDCESRTTWFLGDFDLGEKYYNLGPYEADLAPVLSFYAGSFNRLSQAAKPGFTAASLLSTLWSDRQVCQKNETPLACEYRLQKPAVAFIMLGTNDAVNPKTFEGHMRKIIEYTLEQGVLPIIGTKADNVEGDHYINRTMALLAYEYDLPLWNYWLAVQDLPQNGLQADGSHLTYSGPFFDDPKTMRNAWPVRNLNALQILKVVMQKVE
jgi:hypothetical protein